MSETEKEREVRDRGTEERWTGVERGKREERIRERETGVMGQKTFEM